MRRGGVIMKDPAGIINLEELDRISEISGAGDGRFPGGQRRSYFYSD